MQPLLQHRLTSNPCQPIEMRTENPPGTQMNQEKQSSNLTYIIQAKKGTKTGEPTWTAFQTMAFLFSTNQIFAPPSPYPGRSLCRRPRWIDLNSFITPARHPQFLLAFAGHEPHNNGLRPQATKTTEKETVCPGEPNIGKGSSRFHSGKALLVIFMLPSGCSPTTARDDIIWFGLNCDFQYVLCYNLRRLTTTVA